ncbi:MAG: hypothetical protein ABI415_04485 [Flavitalea sp.]
MKKIYVLTVVCLCFAVAGMAQTYYWVGPANGFWSSASNWSSSSGGAGGAGVPNSTAVVVIFNTTSSAKLDIDVDVKTLTITNASTVKLIATGGGNSERNLIVNGTVPATSGLIIDALSRLEDSTESNTFFNVTFASNSQGAINGQWYLTGFDGDSPSYFTMPLLDLETTAVNINSNASITVTGNASMPNNNDFARSYLHFNSGSFLYLTGNGTFVPKATYNANSTVSITGIEDVGIAMGERISLGNVTYNCPLQSLPQSLGLIANIVIGGNLQILSTGTSDLTLMGNVGAANPNIATINGDLTISGTSSVFVSNISGPAKTFNLFINGNLTAGGTKFDFQGINGVTQPTNIFLKGHLQHTAGTFGALSNATNESTALFVLEMNGTFLQNISSVTGTIDNAAHQVSLRMNNAAGVTLLSPLSVGRIDFTGTNQGKLNTDATNILTIQNTSGNSIVVNSPSNSGYVNGPLRRSTASTSPLVIPTGVGGVFRQLTITPSSSAATTYQANLIAGVPSGSLVSPVAGLADYYWDVSRTSGTADAVVGLTVSGAVPGASFGDGLVVAKFDGSSWSNAKGAPPLTPGNTSSGVVSSSLQSSFNLYTIAYGNSASLPINLVSFTGKQNGTAAELSWKITENSTPVNFEVLRSNDGRNFISIGATVVTNGKLNYTFTDGKLLIGNNYYRLKMFDQDASISYSNIIVIMNGTNGILISSIIPTVVRDRARLNINSSLKGNMQLVITDINGRIIQTQNSEIISGNQEVWLDAGRLSSGMFQVTGYIHGERTASMRFIKQ